MRSENRPDSLPSAMPRAFVERADTMSITACASERSILPPRNARFVNSPRSAIRTPTSPSALNVSLTAMGLPCSCSSTTSSVVYVCGARMTSAIHSSITFSSALITWPKCAVKLFASVSGLPLADLNTLPAFSIAPTPLTRTMLTPPRPGGVATAAMTSSCMSLPLSFSCISVLYHIRRINTRRVFLTFHV